MPPRHEVSIGALQIARDRAISERDEIGKRLGHATGALCFAHDGCDAVRREYTRAEEIVEELDRSIFALQELEQQPRDTVAPPPPPKDPAS